ncbi:hypothetical protein OQA88_2873 [Cercophora sp. LCS_1]
MAITKLPTAPSEDGSSVIVIPVSSAPDPAPASAHNRTLSTTSTATLDVEAWASEALASLTVSPAACGTGSTLSIPLDAVANSSPQLRLRNVQFDPSGGGAGITPPRRAPATPARRDSVKRREELLRGKEGTRQRRRWENDHLLGVPNAQPPTPSDWLIHPTHPVLDTVPYAIAQYWDKGLRERVEERKAAFAATRRKKVVDDEDIGKVPRDLRATVKKTPAVKSWLKVLEEPVRQFVVEKGLAIGESVESEDDDEVVFVGRNGGMMDAKEFKKAQIVSKEKQLQEGIVLDTIGDDESGPFRRFLTHSISEYYGLSSKSVTVGNPARRVVYIGVKQPGKRHAPPLRMVLPPPLWEMF